MGYGHSYRCLDCGETGEVILGVGMMYPEVCHETKEKASLGEIGQKLEEIVHQHPEGKFDCTRIIYACDCGGWKVAPRMDYYTLDNSKGGVNSDNPYSSLEQIGGTPVYRSHMCSRCRRKMHLFPKSGIGSLTCPRCAGTLEFQLNTIMWD